MEIKRGMVDLEIYGLLEFVVMPNTNQLVRQDFPTYKYIVILSPLCRTL